MARYATKIQWGGLDADWHDDHELNIAISNRNAVVPTDARPATGTTVTWSGPNGSATITFFDNGQSFAGTAQFPNEGPVGYRGTAK